MSLPTFPTDDATLAALEHALGGALDFPDGEPVLTGADYSLRQMLDAYAQHDPNDAVMVGYTDHGTPIYATRTPSYNERDVIAALIAEIRRLRTEENQ